MDLKLYLVTYNVGTESPKEDLRKLLGMHKSDRPHVYALSFQEVKSQPLDMVRDTFMEDPWTSACTDLLQEDYVKIKSIRLQGLLLVVYVLRKHFFFTRDVESEYTRTGLGGIWGNKGAVSVRLTIHGRSICFVNSHLAAHDQYLQDRIDDYNAIVEDQKFHYNADDSKIFDHDYVFWMGDLNFRLSEDYNGTPEDIVTKIKSNKWNDLLEHDQLKQVIKNGKAFARMTEDDPKFPPTFKFEEDSSEYNLKRRPAWCDRILYKTNSKSKQLCVQQLTYEAHSEYKKSDHKPVTAEFLVQYFSGLYSSSTTTDGPDSTNQVKFDPIPVWTGKILFRISGNIGENDWIGVFKKNFSSVDDYLTYEYVKNCAKPLDQTIDRFKPFELEMAATLNQGNYCLVYFAENEHKVRSPLAVSDNFLIN